MLAGALGLKGDLDEARAALAESLKLNPKINSFAAQRANVPSAAYPPHASAGGWVNRLAAESRAVHQPACLFS